MLFVCLTPPEGQLPGVRTGVCGVCSTKNSAWHTVALRDDTEYGEKEGVAFMHIPFSVSRWSRPYPSFFLFTLYFLIET